MTQCNNVTIIDRIEQFLRRFSTLPEDGYYLVIALWIVCTYLWPDFDAFPYLTITADTKRSGKTRLAELMSFCCSNPRNFGAMTPASLFRSIEHEKPTIFFDEAEVLSGESANTMRAVLNVGYRKGQTIPRVIGGQVKEFNTYCPKVFILIGDVYDTLKDRSVIVRCRRGEPRERFVYENAKAEGELIRQEIDDALAGGRAIQELYANHKGLEFLTDRDEEVWTPLFCVCEMLAPSRLEQLTRQAVDMATEKTWESRRYVNLRKMEDEAQEEEYAERLLCDVHDVLVKHKRSHGHAPLIAKRVVIALPALEQTKVFTIGRGGRTFGQLPTVDLLKALHDMPTAPWRKYQSDRASGTAHTPGVLSEKWKKLTGGLTATNMARMLSRFGVKARVLRFGTSTVRGYRLGDVEKALKGIK